MSEKSQNEQKFRKKPVLIEAWQKFRKKPVVIEAYQTDRERIILTLEGEMKANKGDMIIRGIKGEIYPCKKNIFDATYEKESGHNE